MLNTNVRNIIPIDNMEPEDIISLITKKMKVQRENEDSGHSRGRKVEPNRYYETET